MNRSLLEKRPEKRKRQRKVIFFTTMLHGLWRNRFASRWKCSWEVLPLTAYSPDLVPSYYHSFASMDHALAEQRLGSYEDVKKMAQLMVGNKRGIDLLAWHSHMRKTYNNRWSIFWIKHIFIILPNLTCFLEKKYLYTLYFESFIEDITGTYNYVTPAIIYFRNDDYSVFWTLPHCNFPISYTRPSSSLSSSFSKQGFSSQFTSTLLNLHFMSKIQMRRLQLTWLHVATTWSRFYLVSSTPVVCCLLLTPCGFWRQIGPVLIDNILYNWKVAKFVFHFNFNRSLELSVLSDSDVQIGHLRTRTIGTYFCGKILLFVPAVQPWVVGNVSWLDLYCRLRC